MLEGEEDRKSSFPWAASPPVGRYLRNSSLLLTSQAHKRPARSSAREKKMIPAELWQNSAMAEMVSRLTHGRFTGRGDVFYGPCPNGWQNSDQRDVARPRWASDPSRDMEVSAHWTSAAVFSLTRVSPCVSNAPGKGSSHRIPHPTATGQSRGTKCILHAEQALPVPYPQPERNHGTPILCCHFFGSCQEEKAR